MYWRINRGPFLSTLACMLVLYFSYGNLLSAKSDQSWPMGEAYRYEAYDSAGHSIFPFTQALKQPGKVHRLEVWFVNEGDIPKDIARFTALEELKIQANSKTQLPDEIWSMTQLTSLELILHEQGQIPEKLAQLTQLKRLLVYGFDLPQAVGQLTQLKELHVGYYQKLPREVWGLKQLRALYLWGNQLKELPPGIGNLKQLQVLLINSSSITQLPEQVWDLTALEQLDLSQNAQLKTLPAGIGKLTNLVNLNLTSNAFISLPPEVGQLSKLVKLDMTNFSDDTTLRLQQLPPEIGKLKQLHTLNLSYNHLTVLPPEIGQLESLVDLNLYHNLLTQLPPQIGQLQNLMFLKVNENPLKGLPRELGQLTSLYTLEFDTAGIPLNTYPDEVCAMYSFPLRLIAKIPGTIAGRSLSTWLKRTDIDSLSRLYVQRKLHMKKKWLTKILDHALEANQGNAGFYLYLFNETIQYSRVRVDTVDNAYNRHDMNFEKKGIEGKVCQYIRQCFVNNPCMVFRQMKYGPYKKVYEHWKYYAWLGFGNELEELGPKIKTKLLNSCGNKYLPDWNELLRYFEEMNSHVEGD